MKLTARKMAAVGAGAAMLALLAGPAFGANVDVLFSSNGGSRTLSLFQPDGSTPLTSTDLSSGTSNFIAKVQDTNYSNNGFKVQATMSNLYGFANNTYNCSSVVPSSKVSLSSPTGLITVGGVSANLAPVFTVVGTLTGGLGGNLPDPLLLTPVNVGTSANNTINGVLPQSLTPLTQSQLTGSSLTNLIGSTLSGALNKLPLNLDLNQADLGGGFTSPDVHPTCDASATNATQRQIMSSTADPTGLLSVVQGLITTALGTSTPTLTQLINGGFISSSQVSTMLQNIIPAGSAPSLVGQLTLTGLTNDLTTIEGDLTANITSVTALAGSLIQSGSYSSSPDLSINTAGIPAGSYKGVMTVTLLDQ